MGFGGTNGAHLRQDDVAAEAGGLQCCFGAGESAADYVDLFHLTLGYVVGGGEGREGFVGQPHDAPLGEDVGADSMVDRNGLLIPVEDIPFETGTALVYSYAGQASEQGFADTVAAQGWGDVEVFEANAVMTAPSGIGREVELEARGGAVVFGDHGSEASRSSPAITKEVRFGGEDGVGFAFELG